MQGEIEQKTVTLIINTGKLTGRTLTSGFSGLLRYTHNKVKEHSTGTTRNMAPHAGESMRIQPLPFPH